MPQTLASTNREFLSRLGITERCSTDDLAEDPDADLLTVAEQHPIVDKFIALRSIAEEGQETIRSIKGPAPVFSLHAGRERGATVADSEHKVIWLLASRIHRGDDHSDAYEHAERLHDRGVLFPTQTDYERLFARRNNEVVPLLLSRVTAALARARQRPGTEHSIVLPGSLMMTLVCEDDPGVGMERLWMALDPRALEPKWLVLIQAALTPGDQAEPWLYTKHFPGRGPDRRELRFTCVHRAPS